MTPTARQSGEPDARAVLAHDAAVRRGEIDPREDQSINLYLQASAAREARAGIDARLADLPDDPYGEAVLVEWYCWDPAFREEGRSAAKTWLIEHNAPGFTGYVQARADFLSDARDHATEVQQSAQLASWFPALSLLAAIALAWLGQRVLSKLADSQP